MERLILTAIAFAFLWPLSLTQNPGTSDRSEIISWWASCIDHVGYASQLGSIPERAEGEFVY